jgi:hypothetical protein
MSELVEKEIEELERKLALKRAYLQVSISFGKGYKSFPEDVRKEVEDTMIAHARTMAEGSTNSKPSITSLTEEEVVILKGYVEAIKNRASKPAAAPQTQQKQSSQEPVTLNSVLKRSGADQAQQMTGVLVTLDSVPKEQRQKIMPNSVVSVLKVISNENKYLVRDQEHNQFTVDMEDIDFSQGV